MDDGARAAAAASRAGTRRCRRLTRGEIAPIARCAYALARVTDRPGGRAGERKLAEGIGFKPELPPQLWPGSFAPTKPLGKIRLAWEGRRNGGDPASQETCP